MTGKYLGKLSELAIPLIEWSLGWGWSWREEAHARQGWGEEHSHSGSLIIDNSVTGFAGCDLWHGPDHCRQEPGSRIVLHLPGQPVQHRHCTSGQPDEWLSEAPLSPRASGLQKVLGCGTGPTEIQHLVLLHRAQRDTQDSLILRIRVPPFIILLWF